MRKIYKYCDHIPCNIHEGSIPYAIFLLSRKIYLHSICHTLGVLLWSSNPSVCTNRSLWVRHLLSKNDWYLCYVAQMQPPAVQFLMTVSVTVKSIVLLKNVLLNIWLRKFQSRIVMFSWRAVEGSTTARSRLAHRALCSIGIERTGLSADEHALLKALISELSQLLSISIFSASQSKTLICPIIDHWCLTCREVREI